jgi:heptosyltransferase-2
MWITKLYKNVDIECNTLINCDLKTGKDWLRFYREVRKFKPDVIYEMHQSGRTKKFFDLYSKFFRVPYLFHNHHIKSGGKIHDQGVIKAVIQRDLDGVYSTLSNGERMPNYLDYTPSITYEKQDKKRVVLGVVATRETKMWPLDYYVDLARVIKTHNSDLNVVIPLSTSNVDTEIKIKLEDLGINEFANIVQVSLENLAEYVGNSKLYIGNDTGLKHLAIATGVKTFTLFGPEPPNEWHPYSREDHPYFYRKGLECRTRDAHYCGLSTCESMICLNEIHPSKVFEEVIKDLDE